MCYTTVYVSPLHSTGVVETRCDANAVLVQQVNADTPTTLRTSSARNSVYSASSHPDRHSFDTFDTSGEARRSFEAALPARRSLEALKRSLEQRRNMESEHSSTQALASHPAIYAFSDFFYLFF